ncbi:MULTISPECIES: YfgM family protein [Vibrio]|uniref:YfgM family protein n=1 Tax=Vibrio TaxID=662 RepID=UPI0001B947DA|nr:MULTISPECIES: YfgM family protein [Vibrio]MCM5509861.1 YfgM family protein [Vibrio sp. SCSIO 43169]NRF24433.1 YfgM family protein [Vibrio coralliilyticus]EEX34119.1 membrane protein [Vibrio coralliilyticus ATCC BAA-450]MDE3899860.1 YfgM family protein [Vibrio sp. CC007]NRF62829.1 YfgM family protein [Vibrio coralliilyticus]
MELYDTEEQQVEAIKDWWKENGKAVIFGAVIGLGGLFGWRYYQDSVTAAQEAASESYTKAVQELAAKGAEGEGAVQSFIDANKETQYAVLAALQLAKVQVEAGSLDEALAQLEWAKTATEDQALISVISFRLARLKAEQGEFDAAVSELAAINDESWAGRVAELKGDILLRKGDAEGAYAAYTEAQQADDASQTIQMKLDDLAK